MIGYLKGKVTDLEDNAVIVEVNNIGYNVFVPAGFRESLCLSDEEIKIYTYMQVKEDAFSLFGFQTKDDLRLFRQLLTVNGIGPKGALGLLSAMTANEIRYAIYIKDAKAIAKAPGIGARTAERVILDLSGKITLQDAVHEKEEINEHAVSSQDPETGKIKKAVTEALVALGFSATDAGRAVTSAISSGETAEEKVLKAALRFL